MPLQNATKSKAALSGKKGSQTVYQFRKTGGGDTSFAQYVEHLPEAFITHRVSVDVYPDMLQRLTFMEI